MNENTDKMLVHIYTRQFKLVGYLSIFSCVRLSDYLNEAKPFIPITDAKAYDFTGRALFAAGFLNVRRDGIEFIVQAGQLSEAGCPAVSGSPGNRD